MGDVRFAIRLFLKSPAFTIITVLLLAFGIGATTVLFTAMDAVLLRPLPVRRPEELVRLVQHLPRVGTRSQMPYEFYEVLRDHARSFTAVFGSDQLPVTVTEPGPAEEARVDLVTPEYFETLRVPAAYGRTLTRDDARETGGMPPIVLSDRFWRRHFGGAPSAIGQSVTLHAHRFIVVGVLPREFNGITVDTAPDLRVPIRALPLLAIDSSAADVRRMQLDLSARLRPGITRRQALAECLTFWWPAMQSFLNAFPNLSPSFIRAEINVGMDIEPLERGVSMLRERYSGALELLFASAGLLLLLVCANLAGLLLVRSAARSEEIAVRLALGATRERLARQMLIESGLLAVIGATGGWAIAVVATPLLLNALPPLRDAATERVALSLHVGPDHRVLLFSLATAVLTVLLFGLAPALATSRTSVDAVLRGVRATGRGRGRQFLVVCQIALCTLLLAGAALLTRTFEQLRNADAGFDRDHVITFTSDPLLAGYTDQQNATLQANLRARVRDVPGVISAATANIGILRGSGMKTTVAPAGQRITRGDFMNTSLNGVSPEYFDALSIPLLRGRGLQLQDSASQKPTHVVVNETFVRQFFPNIDPIGKRFGNEHDGIAQPVNEIVGVVKDAKYRSLREPMTPTVYLPQRGVGRLQLLVRTHGRPEQVIRPVQQILTSLDPALPFTEIHTLSEEVETSAAGERLTATLASLFGALASVLAAVGLYGILAYAIVQRRREIGIRMALGARPFDIGKWISRQALAMLGAGIALGLAAALLAGPAIRALLYGVPPSDPLSLTAAAFLVALIAAVATAIPLLRATRIDPARALREEN